MFLRYLRTLYPPGIRMGIVLDNFSPHLSTRDDPRVAEWAAANNVELAYTPTNASWLNRIEAQFQALRYFTLDGTDHASHHAQASMIRRYIAIAEWAADTPQPVRAALGARRDPLTGRWAVPAEATIRRTLARLDAEALAAALGAWLSDRDRLRQQHRRRAVAVDGKALRGARCRGRQAHLLAAMDHTTRAVLGPTPSGRRAG